MVVGALTNAIDLIQRLGEYDDKALKSTGLKVIISHSWYISQATLCFVFQKLSNDAKSQLVQTMKSMIDRGLHLLQCIPTSFQTPANLLKNVTCINDAAK